MSRTNFRIALMISKSIKLTMITVLAFIIFSCKSSKKMVENNDVVSEVSQVEKFNQPLEVRAAILACECIKKQENMDDTKYKDCISKSIVKAMENGNPEENKKMDTMDGLQSTISKVQSITRAFLSGLPAGYGSPNVKQEIVNDVFVIKEYSTDETYGYSENNPIMVGGAREKEGVQNEIRFLKALAGPLGFPVIYKRLGSCCNFYSENGNIGGDGIGRGVLDIYEVMHDGLNEPVKLYINMYDSDVLKVPVGGFTLKK